MVFFFGTFGCTSKGYVERETSLARERGGLFRAPFACLSKVVVLVALFWCIGKGYVEGGLLLLRSREREVLIQGLLCSPLKSGGYVRGM